MMPANPLYKVTDVGVAAVASNCPRLRFVHLSIEGLTDAAVHLVIQSCPDIEELELESCNEVTNDAFEPLKEHPSSHLKRLSVVDCSRVDCKLLRATVGSCHPSCEFGYNMPF